MLRSALVILTALTVAAGCGSKPTTSTQALLVAVRFEPGTSSQCIRVVATPVSGTPGETAAISRKETVNVALFRAAGWSDEVAIVARGFASCADASDQFIESSDSVTRAFPAGEPERVELIIKKTPVANDNDGDGKTGADDCDDADPERFVGNVELCNSSKDNNCSLSTGCLDPLCTGGCSVTGLGTCQSGVCMGSSELSCVDQADNDADSLIDCADPDCLSQSCSDGTACTTGDVCRGDGGCAGVGITVSCGTAPGSCFLAPGSCNPVDGGCLFPMKDAGTVCSDGNACTQNERCTATGDCAGPAMTTTTCTTPPNSQCYAATGTCDPLDGGCGYPTTTGACDDGLMCTENDACNGGTCTGTAKLCFQSSDPCKLDGGSCNPTDGLCVFGNAPNTNSCNDLNACTLLDRCTNGSCVGQSPVSCTALDVCHDAGTCDPGTGSCSNPTVSCTPRSECETAGVCAVSTSGCAFTPANEGGACNNATGTCQSGACVPNFIPFDANPAASNFAPDAGRMPTEALRINCAATLDTGTTGTATFNACSQTLSSADGGLEIITQGGISTVLVRAVSLAVADAGSITITGGRPVIFAIYGNADVRGVIDASASGGTSGPGSGNDCTGPEFGVKYFDQGGSGGGGAAFGGSGGNGGVGEGTADNGLGGSASGSPALSPLRGGCTGGFGGTTALPVPQAGGGGGAVQLSVAGTLRLSGAIVANGGGGQGGAQANGEGEGGAGAGSGGAILLEADNVILKASARLYANGGSGGEGGNDENTTRGASGNDGIRAYGVTPAPTGITNGTAGGPGGGGATPAGGNVTSTPSTSDGGGGGGGSSGRVRINYASGCRENGYVISPSNASTTSTPQADTGFTSNTGSIFAIGTGGSCP